MNPCYRKENLFTWYHVLGKIILLSSRLNRIATNNTWIPDLHHQQQQLYHCITSPSRHVANHLSEKKFNFMIIWDVLGVVSCWSLGVILFHIWFLTLSRFWYCLQEKLQTMKWKAKIQKYVTVKCSMHHIQLRHIINKMISLFCSARRFATLIDLINRTGPCNRMID